MFSGDVLLAKVKGPCLFWEKDWGAINQESFYCERTVPVIYMGGLNEPFYSGCAAGENQK